MKFKALSKKGNFWKITGTIPNPQQTYPNYGQNFSIGVVADSLELAIIEARKQIPMATFLDAHHYGEVHIVTPPK